MSGWVELDKLQCGGPLAKGWGELWRSEEQYKLLGIALFFDLWVGGGHRPAFYFVTKPYSQLELLSACPSENKMHDDNRKEIVGLHIFCYRWQQTLQSQMFPQLHQNKTLHNISKPV